MSKKILSHCFFEVKTIEEFQKISLIFDFLKIGYVVNSYHNYPFFMYTFSDSFSSVNIKKEDLLSFSLKEIFIEDILKY